MRLGVSLFLKPILLFWPQSTDGICLLGEDEEINGPNPAPEEVGFFSELQNAVGEFGSSPSNSLTEEQQQRIERNKQIALERRQAKLQFSSQSQDHGEFLKRR